MSVLGAFTTVTAPTLKKVTQPAWIRFETEYTVCRMKIAEMI